MKTTKVIYLLITVFFYSLFNSCNHKECCNHNSAKIVGTGDLVSESLNLSSFNGFSLVGAGSVTITKGDTQKVIVRAQQNILDILTIQVNSNALILSSDDYNIQTSTGIFLDITTPNPITGLNITGAGNIDISGDKQNSLDIHISGTGNINSYKLEVDNCNIILSGTGNCKVYVNKVLNVTMSGVGNVQFKGHPTINQTISGLGKVEDNN